MRKRGFWVIVCGVLLTLGVHSHVWVLYHLLRAITGLLA